jgi:hypothetical protein
MGAADRTLGCWNPDPVLFSGLVSLGGAGPSHRTPAGVAGNRAQTSRAEVDRRAGVPRARCRETASGLNPQNPDRHDGAEYGQAADGPAGDVNRAVRFGPVHHGIVPMRHDRLPSLL